MCNVAIVTDRFKSNYYVHHQTHSEIKENFVRVRIKWLGIELESLVSKPNFYKMANLYTVNEKPYSDVLVILVVFGFNL